MDAVPAGLSENIRQISQNVSGVVSVEAVRVRAVGNEVFAELAIGVARTLSLERVAIIKSDVITAVEAAYRKRRVSLSVGHRLDDAASARR